MSGYGNPPKKSQFKKGQSGNPNGRPKKYITTLKESGYKKGEVIDTIEVMMSMTSDEIKEVVLNPNATILEKTIANAMFTSLKRGTLYSLDILLNRIYGKPKETIDTNSKVQLEGKLKVEVVNSSIPLSNRETDVDVSK